MAPNVPAEIDVFTVPHSRMKELVNIYTQKVQCIDYRDCQQVGTLLIELKSILHEFKSHESIENMFIMDQLKTRLKQRHIYNSAVCDCHNDNRLTEVMTLVKSGRHFSESTVGERINFGKELQYRFIDFVEQFLPHMEEEETIFQPLLVEHFEYEELCILKEVVLEQHELIRDPQYQEKAERDTPETDEAIKDFRDLDAESCYLGDLFVNNFDHKFTNNGRESVDLCGVNSQVLDIHQTRVTNERNLWSNSNYSKEICEPEDYSISLPSEILMIIFSHLQPPDRGRCAQVCSSWNQAVYSPSLWKNLYPVQWATGIWAWRDYKLANQLEDEATLQIDIRSSKCDEDADVDECEEDSDPICEQQCFLFTSLIEHVFPRIGTGVERLLLDGGRGLSPRLLNEALALCPNVTYISAAYTLFDYYTLKGLWRYNCLKKLTYLDLQGCEFVDDNVLNALAECFNIQINNESLQSFFCPKSQMYICNVACNYANNDEICPCPYDVRWLGNETEIEELYNKVYDCKCYGRLSYTSTTRASGSDKAGCLNESMNAPSLLTLNLSGCWRITDEGIGRLLDSGILRNLFSLNVGGCFHLSGGILNALGQECTYLNPENLTYCNNIRNGPYANQANGCDTIDHPIKMCCQSLVKY